MKKIEIPVCEDTIFNCIVSGVCFLLIGMVFAFGITLSLNEDFPSNLLSIPCFVFGWMFFEMIWGLIWNRKSLIGRINPFKLSGDCSR